MRVVGTFVQRVDQEDHNVDVTLCNARRDLSIAAMRARLHARIHRQLVQNRFQSRFFQTYDEPLTPPPPMVDTVG